MRNGDRPMTCTSSVEVMGLCSNPSWAPDQGLFVEA